MFYFISFFLRRCILSALNLTYCISVLETNIPYTLLFLQLFVFDWMPDYTSCIVVGEISKEQCIATMSSTKLKRMWKIKSYEELEPYVYSLSQCPYIASKDYIFFLVWIFHHHQPCMCHHHKKKKYKKEKRTVLCTNNT